MVSLRSSARKAQLSSSDVRPGSVASSADEAGSRRPKAAALGVLSPQTDPDTPMTSPRKDVSGGNCGRDQRRTESIWPASSREQSTLGNQRSDRSETSSPRRPTCRLDRSDVVIVLGRRVGEPLRD